MKRALSMLGRAKVAFLGRIASGAERVFANGRRPPALLARLFTHREDRLFAALGGGVSFQILRTAHHIGLFALLHDKAGLSVDEIAGVLSLTPHAIEVLLLGLVSMRLVERIDERHYLDPVLAGLLSGKADGGALGKILAFFDEVINPASLHLEESVRSGQPVGLHRLFGVEAASFYAIIAQDPRLGAVFHEAMCADTALNRDRVADSTVFATHRRLLDVGGNSGELAMAIAARHPAIRISVLDFPEAAEKARRRFREKGLDGRLDAIGIDLRRTPFPRGYDAILFAHFLDIFSKSEVQGFLAKAHEALLPGGTVCVFGSVMHDDERGPAMYGVLSSYFLCLADGRGRFYTAAQIADAMRVAGFEDIERTLLPRSEVVLQGKKSDPRAPPKLVAFIRLGRPKFLAYSLLLYGLGAATVVHDGGGVRIAPFAHGLAFVWLAHLMTHYANERFDLVADAANVAPTGWTGGSRVLVEGYLPARVSLTAACALLVAASALALAMPSFGTRALALLVLALGWFYTAPPIALNYRGLGEVAVAVGLNVAVPFLAYGLQGGRIGASSALVAVVVPTFVAQVARMLVMNLMDREGDERVGKRTLAVALGSARTMAAFTGAQIVVYAAVLVLVLAGVLPALAGGAMFLTSPIAVWLARRLGAGVARDRTNARSLAFWASTHVALLVAAATLGLLASAPLPLTGAHATSVAVCTVILLSFGALLAVELRREGIRRAA
jgi:1,4-dihydroxy-2-naphthoate octaprenyltransferase